MSNLRCKIARLFTIKTRWEACFLIYAIALGAVERGRLYLQAYPGASGWLMFTACLGVVFVAGAKLFDSVRPPPCPDSAVETCATGLGARA